VRRTVCLYSPSLVLAGWAAAWAAGATTNGVMVVALLAEAVAIWLHVREQLRRFNGRPVRTVRARRRAEDRRRTYRDFWLLAISAVVVWALFAAKGETDTRTGQFCHLITARIADLDQRVRDTESYLNSPAGRERTGINGFIRKASLPNLRDQVRTERRNLPPVCR
jgi:hypothetical protein